MPESRAGTQFGPYRLDELLGRGGMGEVYRAYDTAKDREVALKLLNPQLADDQVYQERFRRESRAVARLGEPHIIPIHDFGDLDGVLYLDMRLVSGRDLRKVLAAGALPPERAVGLIVQIAEALDAAHEDGLVHRDVKPENILVTDHDFAYLVDFGIAQADSSTHLTQTGSTIGSFAYMAPEQFDNEDASPASDIYALSAVLFECLTGRVPHPAGTVSKAIKAVVLDPTPTLRSLNADLPEALEPVIARGLAKDPAQRFSSAAELAKQARAALGIGPDQTAVNDAGIGESTTISLVKSDGATVPVAGTASNSETEVIGADAEPGAYDATQYAVPAYSPTMVRPSGPVPLGAGYVSAPQPGQVSQPQPGHVSQPQPGRVSQPQPYPPVQYSAAPAGYGPPGYPNGQRPRRSMIPILAAVAVVLLIVLGGVIYLAVASKSSDTAGPATVTHTVSTQESPTPTTAAVPAPSSTPCDATVGVGSDVTSCPFAAAVRAAYLSSGVNGQARQVTAYSPVTGMSYVMACNPQGSAVVCTGGNNAVVVIY